MPYAFIFFFSCKAKLITTFGDDGDAEREAQLMRDYGLISVEKTLIKGLLFLLKAGPVKKWNSLYSE